MTHITEEWKPVLGFEEYYEVSSAGRFKRIKPSRGTQPGKILKPNLGKRGYYQVTIRTDQGRHELYLHSIVASAFLGSRPEGYDVNHIDGNKHNNRAENLEYATRKSNIQHAVLRGLTRTGESCCNAKLRNADVAVIRKLFPSMHPADIARIYRVSPATIWDIVRGRTWKYLREATGSRPDVPPQDGETVFTEIDIKDVTPKENG
jgi:hypothetical protein